MQLAARCSSRRSVLNARGRERSAGPGSGSYSSRAASHEPASPDPKSIRLDTQFASGRAVVSAHCRDSVNASISFVRPTIFQSSLVGSTNFTVEFKYVASTCVGGECAPFCEPGDPLHTSRPSISHAPASAQSRVAPPAYLTTKASPHFSGVSSLE